MPICRGFTSATVARIPESRKSGEICCAKSAKSAKSPGNLRPGGWERGSWRRPDPAVTVFRGGATAPLPASTEAAMDYMQGIVEDYLTAGEGLFIIPECLVKLDAASPSRTGTGTATWRPWTSSASGCSSARSPTQGSPRRYSRDSAGGARTGPRSARPCNGTTAPYRVGSPAAVFRPRRVRPRDPLQARADMAAGGTEMLAPEIVSLRRVGWRLESLESLPAES